MKMDARKARRFAVPFLHERLSAAFSTIFWQRKILQNCACEALREMSLRLLRAFPRRLQTLVLSCRCGGLLAVRAYPSQPAGAVPWLTSRRLPSFRFIRFR
jgi:hypothetical protein